MWEKRGHVGKKIACRFGFLIAKPEVRISPDMVPKSSLRAFAFLIFMTFDNPFSSRKNLLGSCSSM